MQGNDFVQSVMYRRGDHLLHLATMCMARTIMRSCESPPTRSAWTAMAPVRRMVRTRRRSRSTRTTRDGSPGSQCVACHMPAIESEGVPGTFVHAHTFRFITPAMTDKYKIPNPCTSCHKDKTTAWAADAMRHWPEQSPWRSAP